VSSVRKQLQFLSAAILLLSSIAWANPSLTVTGVTPQAGTPMTFTVNFNPDQAAVVGMQFDLMLLPGQTAGTITPAAGVIAAGKSISAHVIGGNQWRFMINGFNSTPITSMTLFTAQAITGAGTPPGTITIPLTNILYTDAHGSVIGDFTLPASPPVITSLTSATAIEGSPFTYTITASNNPANFNAIGLPLGLSINTATGQISGTPTGVGVSSVTLSATATGGTGNAVLRLTVSTAQPPTATTGVSASPLASVRVYPNPFKPNRGADTITFDQIPAGSTVKIFTVSARWVATVTADSMGKAHWNLTNNSGDKVASGIYLYLITDGQGDKTRGTLTVIK
jgi:hypothetical protein